ncbi:MAG: ABC transporter ATP-binding protein, partial [Candidatus Hydrogenedentota bacterium]
MSESTSDHVIEVKNLTRKFRRKLALDDVTLDVPKGCVYGLLGANGAGKTTLINHLLGSYIPQSGTVRVLGDDPIKHPEKTMKHVGYMSEDRVMPSWMKIRELVKFTSAFYPNWDPKFAQHLLELFTLDPESKVKTLSRGERAKAELLTALVHRPDLLILDEPSSGLDVIVRQEILKAIVRDVAGEGRTVFFSSHLLDEVERVSDYVAIMVQGQIVLADSLENILAAHTRITIRYDQAQETTPDIPGALYCTGSGQHWTVICNGDGESLRHELEQSGASIVDKQSPTLEEVFVARTKSQPDKEPA